MKIYYFVGGRSLFCQKDIHILWEGDNYFTGGKLYFSGGRYLFSREGCIHVCRTQTCEVAQSSNMKIYYFVGDNYFAGRI